MYKSEILLFCVACMVSMRTCKPPYGEDSSTSTVTDMSCTYDTTDIQLDASEDTLTTIERIMCDRPSVNLGTEFLGLKFDAVKIQSKVIDILHNMVNSDILNYHVINNIEYDPRSIACDNVTDYLVYTYEMVKNLTMSLDQIVSSSACSKNVFVHLLKDDLKQLSLQADHVVCSMTINGLFKMIDVSDIFIGPLNTVSACADPSVNHVPAADVLKMIYGLTTLMEQMALQAYDDISKQCSNRDCIETSNKVEEIFG